MSFVSKLQDATIGFSGYPRLLRDRSGGFGYMALLLFIVLSISAVVSTVTAKRDLEYWASRVASGPDFAFENGELRFEGPMPHRIEEGVVLIVVDTTGRTGPEVLSGRAAGILFTKDKVYQVGFFGQVQETDLKQMPAPVNLEKEHVVELMRSAYVIVPFAYIFIYIGQLVFKAADAMVLGYIASSLMARAGRRIPFEVGFKAGLYAMSLPILIQWFYLGFTTLTPFGFITWWSLAVFYLVMGLRAAEAEGAI